MRRFSGWLVFLALVVVAAWQLVPFTVCAEPKRPARYETIRVTVKAYCPCRRCCGVNANGKTADGRRIRKSDYTIAVSRDIEAYYPMGSRLHVPGYGIATVRDRTHRRRWRQVEVLMTVWKNGKSPHRRALEWGSRTMDLKVRRR